MFLSVKITYFCAIAAAVVEQPCGALVMHDSESGMTMSSWLGSSEADILTASAYDTFYAANTAIGLGGNDTLTGAATATGNDILIATANNGRRGYDIPVNSLDGGDGIDTVDYQQSARVRVDLDARYAVQYTSSDHLANIETSLPLRTMTSSGAMPAPTGSPAAEPTIRSPAMPAVTPSLLQPPPTIQPPIPWVAATATTP